jgi:hypothetical protein
MQFLFHYPEVNGTEMDMLDPGNVEDVATAAPTSRLLPIETPYSSPKPPPPSTGCRAEGSCSASGSAAIPSWRGTVSPTRPMVDAAPPPA